MFGCDSYSYFLRRWFFFFQTVSSSSHRPELSFKRGLFQIAPAKAEALPQQRLPKIDDALGFFVVVAV